MNKRQKKKQAKKMRDEFFAFYKALGVTLWPAQRLMGDMFIILNRSRIRYASHATDTLTATKEG